MLHTITRRLPIVGGVAGIALLAISAFQYAGDVHATRVTVSLLCAPALPNGDPNLGRGVLIAALLLLCASTSLIFELISRLADTRGQRKTIQIAGIGAMIYAVLTATPMHNLMVNMALAFFLVALLGIVNMLYRRRRCRLTVTGIACIALNLCSASLYYTNTYTAIWGVLQKVSFLLTITWLFAVLLTVTPRSVAT